MLKRVNFLLSILYSVRSDDCRNLSFSLIFCFDAFENYAIKKYAVEENLCIFTSFLL